MISAKIIITVMLVLGMSTTATVGFDEDESIVKILSFTFLFIGSIALLWSVL